MNNMLCDFRYLDDVSLHHLINALCSLSMEAMEMAYGNNKVRGFQISAVMMLKIRLINSFHVLNLSYLVGQEPSLFAVAKLLETGLVNMDRIEILWRPLTAHLLEVRYIYIYYLYLLFCFKVIFVHLFCLIYII